MWCDTAFFGGVNVFSTISDTSLGAETPRGECDDEIHSTGELYLIEHRTVRDQAGSSQGRCGREKNGGKRMFHILGHEIYFSLDPVTASILKQVLL
jgi:hypothetical protein